EPIIVRTDCRTQETGFMATYRWERRNGSPLLQGQAGCLCQLLSPDSYTLDLDYRFATPGGTPVTLDRHPPPEAGYAGLSLRLTREFRHARYLDADGRTAPPPRGTRTAWHGYHGSFDGGPDRRGGAVLMDHP